MKYALDTNIITYYLKGNEKIIDKVDEEAENDNIIITPFAYYEVKKWLLAINSKSKFQAFEKLFEEYGIGVIDKATFDLALSIYIKMRKDGLTVDDGDLLIAAYCIHYELTLVTNNEKHFKNIANLKMVNWL